MLLLQPFFLALVVQLVFGRVSALDHLLESRIRCHKDTQILITITIDWIFDTISPCFKNNTVKNQLAASKNIGSNCGLHLTQDSNPSFLTQYQSLNNVLTAKNRRKKSRD